MKYIKTYEFWNFRKLKNRKLKKLMMQLAPLTDKIVKILEEAYPEIEIDISVDFESNTIYIYKLVHELYKYLLISFYCNKDSFELDVEKIEYSGGKIIAKEFVTYIEDLLEKYAINKKINKEPEYTLKVGKTMTHSEFDADHKTLIIKYESIPEIVEEMMISKHILQQINTIYKKSIF